MSTAGKVIRLFNHRLILELAIFGAFAALLEVASVWMLRVVFLLMLGGQSTRLQIVAKWLPADLYGALSVSLATALLFIVFKNVTLAFLWHAALSRLAGEQSDLAAQLFEKYLRMPYRSYIAHSRTMSQNNLSVINNQMFIQIVVPMFQTYSESLVLLAIVIYMLILSPLETLLLSLWLFVVLTTFRAVIIRQSHTAGYRRRASADGMIRLVQESLADLKSIKLWARESFFVQLFRKAASDHAHVLTEDRFFQLLPRFVLEPALIGGLATLYVVLTQFVHAGRAELVSQLSLFAAASIRILPAAQRISSQLQTTAFNRADIDAIFFDLDSPTEIALERPNGKLQAPFERTITLQNVVLRYGPDKPPALRGVSLCIHRGDKIAVLGSTGSGKTSLFNVLLGLLPPSQGNVLIDGSAVLLLSRFRHTAMAFVPQDTFLLNSTIAANVAFGVGKNNANGENIWLSLRRARLEERVRSFPEGLQTCIGENGIMLSGGERQRLALARAFYQRPEFLVLDEATSQLDQATEAEILTDILESDPSLTVVMSTHRVSTVAKFSRFLQVDNGHVSEILSPVDAHQPGQFVSPW